jgi:hypothetical protein
MNLAGSPHSIKEILRFAQDFACGLPLCSRPQPGSKLPDYQITQLPNLFCGKRKYGLKKELGGF